MVPAEMLARYDIKTVDDLVTASPGSFTGSYFGVPGALFIRGEAGDNFYRGFRRVENRGNYATPVADAEELEIVKGPPSPIYGGGKVGGFLNYTPKSARSTTAKWLEHPTGKITMTYGSYDQKIGSVEGGSPFKIGQYRGGFYRSGDARTRVAGVSGNGQKQLVEVIAGQRPALSGTITVNGAVHLPDRETLRRHRFFILPEEPLQNASVARMTVAENMAFRVFDQAPFQRAGFLLDRAAIDRLSRGLIARFSVRPPSPDMPIGDLSGGNVQRAILARELASGDVCVLVAANPCFGSTSKPLTSFTTCWSKPATRGLRYC